MQAILEKLAGHLMEAWGQRLGDVRIILPNRRSGLFLQQHLSGLSPGVTWAPRISTIEDFIRESSRLKLSDPVEDLFTLYDLYCEVKEDPGPVDEFSYWGERMLRDFDELDKYLVDADMLFRNIRDLREIEEPLAGLDDRQLVFIRQFWQGFHEGGLTPEKEQFMEVWEQLPLLYRRLREELESRGEGYQGMLYREIAERIGRREAGDPEDSPVVVAGFNALNACEKIIFKWLGDRGAMFIWDHDVAYSGDPDSEAGRFMRENLAAFPPEVQLEAFRGLDGEKEISVYELPSDLLQAKTVFRLLEQKDLADLRDCTDTAVVLCDEDLLMPVLLSLPGSIGESNVTMGYPMRNTPVAALVEALLRMQNNLRRDRDGKLGFYHRDVKTVLLHPYLRGQEEAGQHPVLEALARENMILVEEDLFSSTLERLVFRQVEDPGEFTGYFREIFLHILEDLQGDGEALLPELHREFIFQLLVQLNKLESLLARRPGIPLALLERLFRRQLAGIRIPFEGEPLSGLQIMGILETRLLDFRHVIMLSVNEDVIPASRFSQSYIPYNLRLAFGMPSREDMDSIYAYYFYRLIQRAEKVDLLFNSTSEGIRTGEMSRYVHQLMYSRGARISRPGLEIMAREVRPISIPHSRHTGRLLEAFTPEGEGERYLSPSALNTYLDCPLKFYLRYLAGIGETDEVLEEIDAAGFGTVVHETLSRLYDGIAGRNGGMIRREDLKSIRDRERILEILEDAFRKEHFRGRKQSPIEGRNIIILQVMLRFVQQVIDVDAGIAPFTLVTAEKTYRRSLEIRVGGKQREICLGGKIDRVDRSGEKLRVIDSKTGSAKPGFASLDSLFDPSIPSRNSAAFQTLLYAWLVSGSHPGETVTPGLYVMNALRGDPFDPRLVTGSPRTAIDSFAPLEEDFLVQLKQVLEALFDPEIPFGQTTHLAKCRYCDYAEICNRTGFE